MLYSLSTIFPKITERLTKYMTSNMANANAKALLYILSKFNSSYSLRNFFEQLSKYLFKEDDFYNIEETDNYILLKNVINSGYLTDKKYSYLQDSKYVLYSNKIIEEILNKLLFSNSIKLSISKNYFFN